MADFDQRTRTERHTEYVLRSGTPYVELYKALHAAAQDCAAASGKKAEQLAGDALTVHASDDEIVIRFSRDVPEPEAGVRDRTRRAAE